MLTLNPCIVAAVTLGSLISISVSTSLPAQKNATLVKVMKHPSGSGYNDVWGWTAPDYREFAVTGVRIGSTSGSAAWVVETTNNNVRTIAFIRFSAGSRNLWRDFTNYKQYIYSVSEGQRGIEVIDMTNPSSPKYLGAKQTSRITRAHNISVDPDTGYLYLSGSNQGVAIFDAKKNPTNPQFIGSWRNYYTHDACIRRGRAYFANGTQRGTNYVRIVDVRNTSSMPVIGQCLTPGDYAHNAWVSEDDKLLVVTDEIARTTTRRPPHMSVWDISNAKSPKKLGDYKFGNSAVSAHNAFVIGRTSYMSHYHSGVHVIDLGDPTRPTLIAQWDTSTINSGYNGCWGCYPFSDSGLVYGSDMQNGLHVIEINCGHMNRYGKPTVGSNGKTPRARFDGASPRVGASNMRIEIENMLPNAPFVLLLASKRGSARVLGIDVHVDLATTKFLYFRADSNGRASLPAPIPGSAGFAGVRFYMQIAAADRGKPQGFSASRGMWAGICK